MGTDFNGGNAYFKTNRPKDFAPGVYNEDTGLVKFRNVVWFSNLDIKKRHEDLILYRKYSPEEYPKYDNYNAIEVSRTANIPNDWMGCMGVPISFLDKHNPDQFEILGSDYDVKMGLLNEIINPEWQGKIDRGYVNGKRYYARLLIRNRRL